MRNRTSRTCTATNKRGVLCNTPALKGQVYCHAHSPDPEHQERMRAGRSKGGKVRAWNVARAKELALTSLTQHTDQLRTAEDVRRFLSEMANALSLAKIDARVAGQLAFIAAGVLKAIDSAREDALAAAEKGGTRLIILEADEQGDPGTVKLPERDPEILARLAGTNTPELPPIGHLGVIRGNNVRGMSRLGLRPDGTPTKED